MPIARREADVLWEGPLARGSGTLKSGSCFAMALALVLGDDGTPPDRLAVSAACTLD